MTNENEPSLHEKLCAYILGEGTPSERAEMERELQLSPELRAQHDTIERTIGLVKNAMAGSESLSPEAAETLVSAASASRPAPMRVVPWLRIAAGLGAVTLAFAIVRQSSKPTVDSGRMEQDAAVAQLAQNERAASTRGRLDGTRDADAPAAPAAPVTKSPGKKSETYEQNSRDLGAAVPPNGAVESKEADKNVPPPSTTPAPPEGATREQWYRSTESLDSANVIQNDKLVFEDLKRWQQVNQRPPLEFTEEKKADLGERVAQAQAGEAGGLHDRSGAVPPQPKQEFAGKDVFLVDAQQPSGNAARPDAGSVTPGLTTSTAVGVGAPGEKSKDSKSQPAPTSSRGRGASPSGPSTGGPGPSGASAGRSSGGSTPGPSGPATAGGGAKLGSPPAQDAEAKKRLQSMGYSGGAISSERLAKLENSDSFFLGVDRAPSGGIARDDRDEEDRRLDDTRRFYWQLAPADQVVYLDDHCRRIVQSCVRWPNEKPRDMYFRFWGDNPFEVAALDKLSTFAADVDTASYTLARRYINENQIPEKAQIRTEEFVNSFKSDVPAPTEGVFAIHTDLTASRFSTDTTRQMLRVVVRGKDLSKVERKPLRLTFVVDVSGSMREQNRLEMVKHSIRLLVTQLDAYDKIGIVKFSSDASQVLPMTSVAERAKIESAIDPLQPEGSTNSNAGLQLGYAMALGGLDNESISRVVFLSDGVANVGETDPNKIAEGVRVIREKGIYLNTIGVGMNNHNDTLLEQLADKADGVCTYIDTPAEAKKQLVDNFTGAFQPIARDVKIQVEFDPVQVLRYRLLGYENRAVADADFRNDKVDAGELGAGHQVTALYEIERQAASNGEAPLATVRLRWKDPKNFGTNAEQDSAKEISQPVSSGQLKTFEAAGQSYRKHVIAAQFAEFLRRSIHARGDSIDALIAEALRLQKEMPNDTDFTELTALIGKSKDLILRTMPACDELCQAIDQVRDAHYRRAQLEQLQKELDAKTLDDLKKQNDILEARLRELVRRRLENQGK